MFSKLKLGAKLSSGFGGLIIIALLLGGLAVYNMNNVAGQSTQLAKEYVPEVAVAQEIRGAANRIMYEMRGYGLTEQGRFWEGAQKEMAAMDRALEKADRLADTAAHLKKLKGETEKIKQAKAQYVATANETKATIAAMDQVRHTLDANAAKFLKTSREYRGEQTKKLKHDLAERTKKIDLVSHLVELGTTVRVTNFKAQALKNPGLMKKAIGELGGVKALTDELRTITSDPEEIKMIDATVAAAQGYGRAMTQFLAEFKKGDLASNGVLNRLRAEMDRDAATYVKNCDEFLMGQQTKLTEGVAQRQMKIAASTTAIDLINASRISVLKSQSLRDPEILKAGLANFPKIADAFDRIKSLTSKQVDLDRIDVISATGQAYQAAMEAFLADWLKLQKLGQTRDKLGHDVIEASKVMAEAGMTNTSQIATGAMDALSQASLVMIVGLAVALVLGIVLAVMMTRSITRPLMAVTAEVTRTAGGDLTVSLEEIHQRRGDELGDMARDVVKMNHDLSAVMKQIIDAAQTVTSGSEEISAGNLDLSQRVQEQASAIEETAATIEEMTSSTRNNAENANVANDMAGRTTELATEGGRVVDEAIDAMARVAESSRKINEIVDMVNEIAFQTNLLALNASVEAARAGDAGRGFAVVAGEVRNLAGRSAAAAKEIQGLIKESVTRVDEGNELVGRSGETLKEIISNIQQVADTISEITAASREQSSAIDQINIAVSQLDEVTQQNASLVEETAAASESMKSQAVNLSRMVARFKIDPAAGGGRQPAKALAAPEEAEASAKSAPPRGGASESAGSDSQAMVAGPEDDDFFNGDDLEGFTKF